jgi:hypothetical protein
MNAATLRDNFGGNTTVLETVQWLRAEYLPALMERFNVSGVRKRLGLYAGDRIPDNERNLTDVRNRVSLVVEYELARLSNQILSDAGVDDLFWAYVVANRFPDLEIRKNDGSRKLRIEVKNLQSVAEEKSANFDTLKKDINPNTDFVVVFLWEWFWDPTDITWERAPKLLDVFVFHATSLATLRDTYWLNQPPDNLGNGYQGFDIRYGVNCVEGTYAEEEGNYGKLLRIWSPDFPHRPSMTPILTDTEQEYLRLRKRAVSVGFKNLCYFHLPRLSGQAVGGLQPIVIGESRVGEQLGDFGFFLKASGTSNAVVRRIMLENSVHYAVAMTEKYVCTGYRRNNGTVEEVFNKRKPKNLTRSLFGLA